MDISNVQKQRIIEYLKQGKRFDGRAPTEYRDIEVEMNISNSSEASCSVKMGKTHVYAGVKMALVAPYPDSPDEGTMMVSAEMSPLSSEEFELGPPKINAIELARVIDRGIRESKLIDTKKLCVVKGEKVWSVFVDIFAINDDGNLLDVAALAALIAVGHAKLPVYNEKEDKIEHELSKNPLPMDKDAVSFNITLHKVGNQILVDPSKEEEAISDYRVSIAMASNKGKPMITSIQKGKEGTISSEDMEKVIDTVEEVWNKQFDKILKLVFDK